MNRFIPRLLCIACVAACLAAPGTFAKGTSKSSSSGTHKSTYAQGVKRDANGHIARDPKSKQDFMKATGYQHGRPGYVVDHIVPLKRGGADKPSNMQWQTKSAAKAKDKTE